MGTDSPDRLLCGSSNSHPCGLGPAVFEDESAIRRDSSGRGSSVPREAPAVPYRRAGITTVPQATLEVSRLSRQFRAPTVGTVSADQNEAGLAPAQICIDVENCCDRCRRQPNREG